MSVRIRLRRVGRKKQPSYRIVVAESSTPRGGAYIEAIGFYNPRTQPTELRVDMEKLESWLGRGAEMSMTVRSLVRKARRGETTPVPGAAPVEEAPAEEKPAAKAEEKPAKRAKKAPAAEKPAPKAEKPAAKAEKPAAKAEKPAAKAEAPAAEAEKPAAEAEAPAAEAEGEAEAAEAPAEKPAEA